MSTTNLINLDGHLTQDARRISDSFAAANLLIVSTDETGRQTRAYLDAVGFGGMAAQLGGLKKGAVVSIMARLNSSKRGDRWQLRAIVEKLDTNGNQQLALDSE